MVGTRQGHLLMYSVTPGSTRRWDVALLCSNKNFSRKPIIQVAVVPEHQIIVSLSGTVASDRVGMYHIYCLVCVCHPFQLLIALPPLVWQLTLSSFREVDKAKFQIS